MTLEADVKKLKAQMRQAMAVITALEGQPSDATLALPHNDSWLFEDNVDATHPANMRYVISANVTRVVSARLSVHLAPYRTYNSDAGANTGAGTAHAHGNHAHTHATTHAHNWLQGGGAGPYVTTAVADMGGGLSLNLPIAGSLPGVTSNTAPGNTDNSGVNNEAAHTHSLNLVQTLGVTEGTTATGVTISFDGADHTADLGGPFNADVVEIDVRPYLVITTGLWHTIAMQPTGNGRIEAHLRLGVYVAAGSVF